MKNKIIYFCAGVIVSIVFGFFANVSLDRYYLGGMPNDKQSGWQTHQIVFDKWTGTAYYQKGNAFYKYNPKQGTNGIFKYAK